MTRINPRGRELLAGVPCAYFKDTETVTIEQFSGHAEVILGFEEE